MVEYENTPKKKKGHTPPLNHPWRKFVRTEVAEFAREQSKVLDVNNYKKGGGHQSWNGGNEKRK